MSLEHQGPGPSRLPQEGGQVIHTEEELSRFEGIMVEPDGIAGKRIMAMTLAGFVFLLLSVAAVVFWIKITGEARGSELAAQAVSIELRESNLNAERILGQYGILNEEEGVYRIPIERAMQLVAQEGSVNQNSQATEIDAE